MNAGRQRVHSPDDFFMKHTPKPSITWLQIAIHRTDAAPQNDQQHLLPGLPTLR